MEKWIASAAPHINLREADFSPAQWCTVTAALLRTPPSAVTSLHLAASSKLTHDHEELETLHQGRSTGWTCQRATCRSPGNVMRHTGKVVHLLKCETCGNDKSLLTEQCSIDLERLRLERSNIVAYDNMQMLGAVQAVVSHTTALRTLGLHDLYLSPHFFNAFEELLGSLPTSLTKLHLTTVEAYGYTFGVREKRRFFRAVAQVRTLKELHMPLWEAFVGRDAQECTDALQCMAGLIIVVPSLPSLFPNSSAYPSSLNFQARYQDLFSETY